MLLSDEQGNGHMYLPMNTEMQVASSPGQRLAEHTRTLQARRDSVEKCLQGREGRQISRGVWTGSSQTRRFLYAQGCVDQDDRTRTSGPDEPARLSRKRCLSPRMLDGGNPPCGDRQDKDSSH